MLEHKIIEAFWLVLIFSGVPLVLASCVGLIAAVVQTATQVQEQSIGFTLKAAAIACALVASAGFLQAEFSAYLQSALADLAALGRM